MKTNALATIPSSCAREEFLIVLEYLFKFAYDEAHASSQSKIIKYALNEYGVQIRRDRISQILIHLSQLYDLSPERFPFKLHIKQLNCIDKYYVTDWLLTDNEVIDIINSIRNDKTKSRERIELLENKLLSMIGGFEKQKEIKNRVNKTITKAVHLSKHENAILNTLRNASEKKLFVKFKLPFPYPYEVSNCFWEIGKELSSGKELTGYVHSIFNFESGSNVVFYLLNYKAALVVPVSMVDLTEKPINLKEWSKGVDFTINCGRIKTVDEWLKKHYSGKTGDIYIFILAIRKESIDRVIPSLEHYFDTRLTYKIGALDLSSWKGKSKFNISDRFAYTHLTCNKSSFFNWYLKDMNNIYDVVILVPNSVKEFILNHLSKTIEWNKNFNNAK